MPRRKAKEVEVKIEKKKPATVVAKAKANVVKKKPVAVKRAVEKKSAAIKAAAESPTRPQEAVLELDEIVEAEKSLADFADTQHELEQIERSKRMIMVAGVTFFMVVIVGFWMFNLKQVFRSQQPSEAAKLDIDEITENFNKAMAEVGEGLDKFNELKNAINTSATSTEVVASTSPEEIFATTSPAGGTLPQAETATSTEQQVEIEALKARLEELEQGTSQKNKSN